MCAIIFLQVGTEFLWKRKALSHEKQLPPVRLPVKKSVKVKHFCLDDHS